MKTQPHLEVSINRRALFRIAESARRELESLVFKRHPDREWGTFFRFGYKRTSWGVAISFVSAIAPRAGELRRESPIVSFNPAYIRRAIDELGASDLGIGVVHSHPKSWGVVPSDLDDDMDHHFAVELFSSFAPGRPYVSLIVNRNESGELEFSGRAFVDGEWLPVTHLFSAGRSLLRLRSKTIEIPRIAGSMASDAILARWRMLVGDLVANNLRESVVGVIGCSGTGSPAIEALARAQVGEFVLIDPDHLSISNIERLHGSRVSDLDEETAPFKVEVLARLISEVNPDAKLTLIAGSSLDEVSIDQLLRCDLLLTCTDTVYGRVHAGDLASRFLVPAIDVGVLPVGKEGRITCQLIEFMRSSPGDPCPFCRDRIDQGLLHRELLSPEELERAKKEFGEAVQRGEAGDAYWGGELPQLPSVGYLTTCAGSMLAGYALNWLLGTAEMPHDHFQLDVGTPHFGFVPIERKRDVLCPCCIFQGFAEQGEERISCPPHFKSAIMLP